MRGVRVPVVEFDLSVTVRRRPDEVLAFVADVQRYGDHSPLVPEMEKIPDGPTRVGTRWREVVRLAPGLRMTVWSEVVSYEPTECLVESFHAGRMGGRLAYTVTPIPGGMLFRQRETLTPKGPLRLFDAQIAGMLGPNLTARLQAIRDQLDAGIAVEVRRSNSLAKLDARGRGVRLGTCELLSEAIR